jgi:UPF0716 protein FxsA
MPVTRGVEVLGRLLLLFIVVPLIELVLLIRLGDVIGLLPTIALVIITGAAGAALARSQGLRVLLRIREELASGRMPVTEMVDGLLIFMAGALLLTPGLLTDVVGLAVLLPGPRGYVKRVIGRRMEGLVRAGSLRVTMYGEPLN